MNTTGIVVKCQDQVRFIICAKAIGLLVPEKEIFKWFLLYKGMAANWSCDH